MSKNFKLKLQKDNGPKKIGHSESTQHWVNTKCQSSWKTEEKIMENVWNGLQKNIKPKKIQEMPQ